MATSRSAESVGRVLGDRYRLTRPLGVGASAHVFAAEDVRLRRRVAVKVLHPALATEEAFLRRFRREAQGVAALRHPNIMRVYDWGEDGGSPYLVMELLEGGSLRSMLDRGALLSPAQAAAVGADAARALDYAHRHGLVHRDIKPANLLFDEEGRVSIADFGLARALAEATWTEPAGAVVGTARYASPELVRGEHLDSKADVYSLALVLVEAVTGQVPFVADTAFGTLMARVGRSLEVPDETGPLKPALESAGAADPAARVDAAGLARDLDAVGAKLPFPAPLSLGGPIESGLVERDDLSPTELPGRPRLFDRTEWEDDEPVAVPAGAGAASAGPGSIPPVEGEPDLGSAGSAGNSSPAGDPAAPPKPAHRVRRAVIAVAAAVVLVGGAVGGWIAATGQLEPKERVPDVAGQPSSQAAAAVARQHLHLVVAGHQYSQAVPSGSVISQTPPPESKLKQGGAVRVVVSDGQQPVPVPNLRNDPVQVAEGILGGLGLKWTSSPQTSMTVPAGAVISNSPNSGTLVPGRSVALVVSSGKPKVPVPPIALTTEPFAQAKAALAQAGLRVTEDLAYNNSVPAGSVISVSPPSGTQIQVGSPVNVVVSKGPHYVSVPGTVQDSVGTATQVLEAQGFQISGVQGNPLNTVKGTYPAGGSQVLYGSSIVILTN
jgi:serine/threonine-protein kinase